MKIIQRQHLDLAGPPGLPPRPGLVWKPETSRWIRPPEGMAETGGLEYPDQDFETEEVDEPRAVLLDLQPQAVWDSAGRALGLTPSQFSELVSQAYAVGVPGYTSQLARIISISSHRPAFNLQVWVRDEEGTPMGELIRHFFRSGDGHLRVEHESFMLDEEHQGMGIAADMTERAEAAYVKAGVESIILHANDEVGGYAWARQGFDFHTESDRIAVQKEGESHIYAWGKKLGWPLPQIKAVVEELYSFQHSWEIAGWNPTNASPGKHWGKAIMLGSDWMAKKTLHPSDPGYQVGLAYRAARRAHAQQ